MRYNAFFGELPINAFKRIGGRMTFEGGGNPISAVTDAVSNVVSGVGDIGQTVINEVGNAGKAIDQTVRDVVPGGWTTAALLAAGYYYQPEIQAFMNAEGATVPASQVADAGGLQTGTAFTGELPAGAAYTAPSVTPLSQVASTEAGAGLGGTGLASMGENAYTAAQDAQDVLAMTGGGGANATLSGVGAIGAANAYPALNAAAAGDVAAAGGTTAAALKAAGMGAAGAAGGTVLADMLPYMAAGQIGTGLLGAYAANQGASAQADAANRAAELQQQNFNLINKQQTPYRAAGTGALNQLGSLGTGTYQMYDAAGNPTGTGTGSGYLQHQFNAADLAAGLAPNYDFMLQQGQMANQRAANMGGGALGGNALQGLNKYTQDYAGNAYQNAFGNYQTQRQNIYNTLAGIAGIGQTGQNATNTAATNATNAASQLGVGSAAAQAAGTTGVANALGNTAGNLINNYTLASLLNQGGRVG